MAKNVEVKARVGDPTALKELLGTISEVLGESIQQEDTFFPVAKGKLKLREEIPTNGELIFYDRTGRQGTQISSYLVHKTNDPSSLKAVLSQSLGVGGVVKKRRVLYKIAQTRIHLDDVVGLGHFIELEFVVNPGQEVAKGIRTIDHLMARLGICRSDLIEHAYVDLLKVDI